MKTKPFDIAYERVETAWQSVRSKRGAPGVDGQTIKAFEQREDKELYKLWNRLSSGSHMADPVLGVEIPKADGSMRLLGVPTVRDRVAQTVVKQALEQELESVFDDSSYGYRPGRSAHDALREARTQCQRCDWVVDLDIEKFFDSLDHELLMKAVRHHTKSRWIMIYIERWIKAPMQLPDGSLVERTRGTPQGGVISPLLANLYLHYAFDHWVRTHHDHIAFERYADDIVCHCRSEREAKRFLQEVRERLEQCKLALHPDKTRIVYCQDSRRKGRYENRRFTFLSYDFHPCKVRLRNGRRLVRFSAEPSRGALKRMSEKVKGWQVHRRSGLNVEQLYEAYAPTLRGWIQYFSALNSGRLWSWVYRWQQRLVRWVMWKFKGVRKRKAVRWWHKLVRCYPHLEPLWNPLKFRSNS